MSFKDGYIVWRLFRNSKILRKKYILLLALTVLLLESSFGQVTKESYEKAVDLLNCKTVELSLKDDKNLMGFQEKCPCNSSSYIQVNQFLESTITLYARKDGMGTDCSEVQ